MWASFAAKAGSLVDAPLFMGLLTIKIPFGNWEATTFGADVSSEPQLQKQSQKGLVCC